MTARPATGLRVSGLLTALLVLSCALPASVGAAIAIKLPLLGSSTEGAKPIEVSIPQITVPLPGVTVSVPAVSVSVRAPALGSSTTSGASSPSTPSVPVTTSTPSVQSTPVVEAASAPPSTKSNSASQSAAAVQPAKTAAALVHESPASSTGRDTGSVKATRKRKAPTRATHTSPHSSVTSAKSTPVLPTGTSGATHVAAKHSRAPKHVSGDAFTSIGRDIPLPIPVPNWSKPIILALLALAIWFGVRARLSARRASRLEGQRETLLRDLDVMQAAVVPDVPALLGGLAVSVAYKPADGPAAGGDFYDVFMPAPGKVALILGDVSGHGHEAVSHAALTRYTLRAYLQAGLEPRAALALAGRVMSDTTDEHFATVAVGVYSEQEGTLTYASAGHPAPLLLGSSACESSEACCSPPIGWSVPTGRRQTTLSLTAGDAVCFFTDGLIEARGSEDLLLGRERVQEIFDSLGAEPEAPELLERVRAASEATPDDLAACVVRAQASGRAKPLHVEELEVDSKALRGKGVPRFLADCRVPSRQVEHILTRARAIADSRGTAMIRVELRRDESRARVSTIDGTSDLIGCLPEVAPALAEHLADPLTAV